MTRDHIGFDASAMRFLLGNVAAETARAQEADDLAPLINNLVELLDQALSQYYALSAEKAALATADMLNPAALTGQVQTLVESIQRNYALHLDDTEHPVVSIVIPVYNKFDLTYQCIRSIQQHGAEIPYEIVIVDDCSRDETRKFCVQRRHPHRAERRQSEFHPLVQPRIRGGARRVCRVPQQ